MRQINLQLSSIVPKARPRLGSGMAYLPERYRDWKKEAELDLRSQVARDFIQFTTASVAIKIIGSVRGDLDNLAGSVLDALVQADILEDDRISCVPALSVIHEPGKAKMVLIELKGI